MGDDGAHQAVGSGPRVVAVGPQAAVEVGEDVLGLEVGYGQGKVGAEQGQGRDLVGGGVLHVAVNEESVEVVGGHPVEESVLAEERMGLALSFRI